MIILLCVNIDAYAKDLIDTKADCKDLNGGVELLFKDPLLSEEYLFKCLNSGSNFVEKNQILDNYNVVLAGTYLSYLYLSNNRIDEANKIINHIIDLIYYKNTYKLSFYYDKGIETIPRDFKNRDEFIVLVEKIVPYYTIDMVIDNQKLLEHTTIDKWGNPRLKISPPYKNITELKNLKNFFNNKFYKKNVKTITTLYKDRGSIRALEAAIAVDYENKISIFPSKYIEIQDNPKITESCGDITDECMSKYEGGENVDFSSKECLYCEYVYFSDVEEEIDKNKNLKKLYNKSINDVKKYYEGIIGMDEESAYKYAVNAVKISILNDIYFK